MDLTRSLLEAVLVPSSLLVLIGYHVYLWRSFKTKHSRSNVGLSSKGRAEWMQKVAKEKEKGGGMLGVQSSRNVLMSAILIATIAMTINVALAALCNNALKTRDRLSPSGFGIQTTGSLVLKYAACSVMLLGSFTCSSMAVGCINEGGILLNSSPEFLKYAEKLLTRGTLMAAVGNRVFFMTFPLLMSLLGPVAMSVASVGIVWVFYNLDFSGERKLRVNMLLSG